MRPVDEKPAVVGAKTPGSARAVGGRRVFSPRTKSALAFFAPSVLLLACVVVFPVAYNLNMSFRSYSLIIPGHTGQWIGLQNYARLLGDQDFWHALLVTATFTVLAVAIELLLGMAVAVALDAVAFGRRLLTSMMIVPMILTPIIIGLMYNFALNPQFGLFTYLINELHLPVPNDVLNNPRTALAALVAIDVWEWTPFMALIMFAGMQALPEEPLQAARVDGASPWQIHWRIVMPMLRPILVVAVLFRAAEAVREFDKVYVLTGGGPGDSTNVMDIFTYRVAFSNWDLSYAATIGMVVFAAMLVASVLFYLVVSWQERQA